MRTRGTYSAARLAGLKRDAGPGRPKGRKNRITVERIEQEIARIALMDPIDLFVRFKDPKTGKHRRFYTLREVQDMDPDTRACIASIKVRAENLNSGDDKQVQTVEIQLWNKLDALTLCAKHFGWLSDKHDVTVHTDELLERLDRGRQRNAEWRKSSRSSASPWGSSGIPAAARMLRQ